MLELVYTELWTMFFEGVEINAGLSENICYMLSIALIVIFIGAIFSVVYYAFKALFDIISN